MEILLPTFLRRALPIAIALAAMLLAIHPPADADAAARTAATEHNSGERVKTVPIARSPFAQPRSVLSVGPKQLGELQVGDRVEGFGEVELTICLKPNPLHPGSGQPCVGKMYGYNPDLKAKLVLAPSAGAAGSGETMAISKTVGITCRQDHPVRNHHCVISIPWTGKKIDDLSKLPCAPGGCYMNMVVSASHPDAGSGELVVVGSSDDKKRIQQGNGKLSAVRYRPGETKAKTRWRSTRPVTKSVPVVAKNSKIKKTVAYSVKIGKLKEGDQLVVDARARSMIKHLPYNVFERTEVVLAKSPRSIKQYGKVLASTARVSASNGFNCTRGPSAHPNGCEIRKGGVMSVKKNAKGPFYVNLVIGQHAIGTAPQYSKWRSGDRSKLPRRGGFVEVRRYDGSGGCPTCSTGWTDFSPTKKPSGKPAKLVSQLGNFGITSGSYDCKMRRDPTTYVCQWKAVGRFGNSPQYQCSSKAWMPKSARSFRINVCKEALAAQLWNELLSGQIAQPTFTGACKSAAGNAYRCKWYGEGIVGRVEGMYCKGYGTYDTGTHRWRIDACTNPNA